MALVMLAVFAILTYLAIYLARHSKLKSWQIFALIFVLLIGLVFLSEFIIPRL